MDDRTRGIIDALRERISHDHDAFAELDDLVRVMKAAKATGIREAAETIAALTARAEAAEAERDELSDRLQQAHEHLSDEGGVAEADPEGAVYSLLGRLRLLVAERDELRTKADSWCGMARQLTEHLERAEAERDELRAELAAMRGEAAPDGWSNGHPSGEAHCYPAKGEAWHKMVGRCRVTVRLGWVPPVGVRWEVAPPNSLNWPTGTADTFTGPDGAFTQAERAAGLEDEGGSRG